jgi:hypothetical protein
MTETIDPTIGNPDEFSIIIIGGNETRELDVQVLGVLEGSLGGPDSRLDIDLSLFTPTEHETIAIGNPNETPVTISIAFGDPGDVPASVDTDWFLL